MTDDLFANLPEVKSPRLIWMEKHGITTEKRVSSMGQAWIAARNKAGEINQSFISRENEHDAIVGLAIKLNLKLWNQ